MLGPLLAAVITAAAVWFAAQQITRAMRASREDAARDRTLAIVQTLAPGIAAARADPQRRGRGSMRRSAKSWMCISGGTRNTCRWRKRCRGCLADLPVHHRQ